MLKYIAPLLICISQIASAQHIFREVPLPKKPKSISVISTSDKLLVSYSYLDRGGIKKTSMFWLDSLGSMHKIPDIDFLNKTFIQVVKNNESDYFYFVEREDNFSYLRALIINRETNNYQVPEAKILIDGYPLGCYESEGKLKFLSFHETTKEFVEVNITKLEVINSKKFLLPVNRLEDFKVIDPNTSLNVGVGRFKTKIFPQRNRTIITIDSKSSHIEGDSLSYTTVFTLDNETEAVSQLNIEEKSIGLFTSFVQENTLVRICNFASAATIHSYDISLKTELSNFSISPDTVITDKTIWKREQDNVTNQAPINSFFYAELKREPTLFVMPVDSATLRICWGSFFYIEEYTNYNYTHTNPNSGNIWVDLLFIFIVEPVVNVGIAAISESIDDAKAPKIESRYFYINYDKHTAKFSNEISNEKTSSELMDEFDLAEKSKLRLTTLGSAKYNNHEYGIYLRQKPRALVFVTFK